MPAPLRNRKKKVSQKNREPIDKKHMLLASKLYEQIVCMNVKLFL